MYIKMKENMHKTAASKNEGGVFPFNVIWHYKYEGNQTMVKTQLRVK